MSKVQAVVWLSLAKVILYQTQIMSRHPALEPNKHIIQVVNQD